jgi:hypothetical protein
MNSDYEKQIEEQAADTAVMYNGYVLFAIHLVFITGTAIGCWIYEVYHG